jgi:molybdopterin-guanine dinucleotide biosynthesis protein A
MGQDKALLCHNGETMLELTVESLRLLTGRIVIVAASADQYCVSGAEVIADLYPGAGPVGGILTGLLALGAGCHFVLACDMPMVCNPVLERLMGMARDNQQCDAVVPEINGETEPLCAVYRDTATSKLAAFMETGRRSAREALCQLNVKRIHQAELRQLDPDLMTFTNINTPVDFKQLPGT